MRRRTGGLVAATAVLVVGAGALVATGRLSSPGASAASAPPPATATVGRRTLKATTRVNGTLGYADSYTVCNTLATAGGANGGNAQQAYASARAQYHQAVAALDALKHPATTEVTQAQAQVAQAQASVRSAGQAASAPGASAALARAQLNAARAQLRAAQAALYALQHPSAAALLQANDALAVAKAGLDAAEAALKLPGGVITQIADVGSTVEPGGVLYTLDGHDPVVLMTGDVPAWRDLQAGVADGIDVRQLETQLQALGFGDASLIVDQHWDAATTAAMKRWQAALGLAETGAVPRGEILFEPGALRITDNTAARGSTVQAGSPILQATSTRRVVTVALDPALQTQVKVGDVVSVILPSGSTAAGSISSVGTVATAPAANAGSSGAASTATIAVTVTLGDPSSAGNLDQAPATVNITTATAQDVLAVPVGALVELLEGGYAVQVDEGGKLHYQPVTLGIFAGGWVQVSGPGLAAGQPIVVAQ